MDESKFSSSCGHNSFYISLHDQKLENPSRQTVSGVHTTRVHFLVQYEQHWAAVQLSISPFSLVQFPSQIFYSSSFRYSLCCHPPPKVHLINSVVQRIYDAHFHPSQWSFSPQYCSTHESRGLNNGVADITCAKKTEKALLDYICSVDADADTVIRAPPRDSNIQISSRNKRRRLDNSHERTDSDSDRNNGAAANRSVADAAAAAEGSVVDDGAAAEGSVDKYKPKNAVKIIANKIRSGIRERTKQIRKSKEEAVSTEKQPENPPAKFATLFELFATQSTEPKPIEDLITTLWVEANGLIQVSEYIAWKYLFICSCLRILHDLRDETKAVKRWVTATRIINSIVNGLWEHWGPVALFVYEAFARKNYSLGHLPRYGEEMWRDVASAVVNDLSGEQLPSELRETEMFHPPASVSTMLNMHYSDVCHRLNLARLAQLCPTEVSQIHVPIWPLQLQWERGSAADKRRRWPLQLQWERVSAADKRRRKEKKTKPNAKRKTISLTGVDHQNSQPPSTPGLNTDSAGNLPNHQLAAWDRIPNGDKIGESGFLGGVVDELLPRAREGVGKRVESESNITDPFLDLETVTSYCDLDPYLELEDNVANCDLDPYRDIESLTLNP